ncbi:MAG: M3 family metallopeptidase [Pseudomonadota bacterium]
MNPLLDTSSLPRFDDIKPEHAEPAIRQLISRHRERLAALLGAEGVGSFDDLVPPLEEMDHELSRVWSPISHLHSVLGDSDWREAYNNCLGVITDYTTELSQNPSLQKAYAAVGKALDSDAEPARAKIVEHALRDFRLAGVTLADADKARFREARQQLAAAQARFEQNVQDSTDTWRHSVADEARLGGLPAQVVERARKEAAAVGEDGWLLQLDFPTYHAVMMHADDRTLRETFYRGWLTRASDQADDAQWDNAPVIGEILALRHELASLVGFDSYAQYSLATKMAATTDEVIGFLDELAERTTGAARAELEALTELAGHDLEAWDTSYYLEKLKKRRYAVSDDVLRPYFPVDKVIEGLFQLAERLYQIRVVPVAGVSGWHDTVAYYELQNADGQAIGGFYTDLYARSGKRAGAWIDECVIRKSLNGDTVLPVGYLVCNFAPPDAAGLSLLTHNDVVTFFHEFGHMLHHLLTRVDFPSIAGINGVPWDAVELPSQFMENFAWSYEVLAASSRHSESGEALPRDLFDKLNASRYCGAALAMLRQLEFALYDFRIHTSYDPDQGARILDVLHDVRDRVALITHPDFNRFPMSFSHIFAGGYAAGYYSYKWAEVLAADAFSAFEERGIFDTSTAASFRREILEVGGSRDIMQAFVAFRGRKPTLDALLRQSGIGIAA